MGAQDGGFQTKQEAFSSRDYWFSNIRYSIAPITMRGAAEAHLPLGVAEYDGLCNRQGVVQVAQGVELPLLLLHRHEELHTNRRKISNRGAK